MIRILTTAILAMAATAAGAQAHPPKPHHESRQCAPKTIGFHATGKLVSQALTQTAGADTSTRRDDRYSGTLTVEVVRANHRAPKGAQTYTLDSDRVHFDGTPKAGDRVKLYGKLTRTAKGCAGATAPTVELNRVRFKAARPV